MINIKNIKVGDYLILKHKDWSENCRVPVNGIYRYKYNNTICFENGFGSYDENGISDDIEIIEVEKDNKEFLKLKEGDTFFDKRGDWYKVIKTIDDITVHKDKDDEVYYSKFATNGRCLQWLGEDLYDDDKFTEIGCDIVSINGIDIND